MPHRGSVEIPNFIWGVEESRVEPRPRIELWQCPPILVRESNPRTPDCGSAETGSDRQTGSDRGPGSDPREISAEKERRGLRELAIEPRTADIAVVLFK